MVTAETRGSLPLAERLREHREQLTGDFVAAIEAQRFLDTMHAEHPAELEEWMHARAVQFVTVALVKQEQAERSRVLRASSLARAFAEGDERELSLYRMPFVIDEENTRRPLGNMRREDLLFAADRYEVDGKHSLAMAAFMRALAKKARTGIVAGVMSEEKCAALLRSFVGPAAP